jgi:uncharacterized protein (TIGR03083 family)
MDDAKTWELIHRERAGMAATLASLAPEQWTEPSLCNGWSVQVTAAHIVVGAEQTPGRFFTRMAANAFRFNTMMDRDARRVGEEPRTEIIERLQARTTTTNHPPAPVKTMLGEIVVHGEDIRRPLGLDGEVSAAAIEACLVMYQGASFPVGAKKRIDGLGLVATDVDWTHGTGPEVSGPGLALLLAVTGRAAGLDALSGDGLATLRGRMVPTG